MSREKRPDLAKHDYMRAEECELWVICLPIALTQPIKCQVFDVWVRAVT